jgi:branched-chain amino acid aminotransferase
LTTWVWAAGATSAASVAAVPADDRAVLLGEGVFETCKVVPETGRLGSGGVTPGGPEIGTPFALTRHLARLRRSASQVGVAVPWSDHEVRAAVAHAVAESAAVWGRARRSAATGAPEGPARLRITVTGGRARSEPTSNGLANGARANEVPTDGAPANGAPVPADPDTGGPLLLVTVGAGREWSPTASVVVSPWRVNEHSPQAGAKTTSHLEYTLALADAQRRGAEEALLTNTSGVLCEASSSNVFLVVGGVLCTPALATGCLPGVTRELVCGLVPVHERTDLTVDDLRSAPEAFLTSSTRDVHPIATVDGGPLDAAPGPATVAAHDALASLQRSTLDP